MKPTVLLLSISLAMTVISRWSCSQVETSPDARCEAALVRSRESASAGKPEEASRLLREALALSVEVKAASKATVLRNQVLTALKKVDPRWTERAAASTSAASELIGLAERYRARGWNTQARELLLTASALDARAAAKPMSKLAPTTADEVSAETQGQNLREWFANAELPYDSTSPWKIVGNRLRSPKLGADPSTTNSTLILPKKGVPFDEYFLEIETVLPPGAEFGLLFGAPDAKSGHMAVLVHRVEPKPPHLGSYEFSLQRMQRAELSRVVMHEEFPTRRERERPVQVRVEVRAHSLRARMNESDWIELPEAPVHPRGRFGLFIASNSVSREPLEFQNLRVGAL